MLLQPIYGVFEVLPCLFRVGVDVCQQLLGQIFPLFVAIIEIPDTLI